MSVRAVKPLARRAAYASGALSADRRLRKRHALAVVTFHRVLAAEDPRWPEADPRYTMPAALFGDCLRFFCRHHEIVGLGQVLDAHAGGAPLPERPLLVTIDDGWADTADTALPLLREADVPAALFVVSSTIGAFTAFWPERIVAAVRTGRVSGERLSELWGAAAGDEPEPPGDELALARALVRELTAWPAPKRQRLLAGEPAFMELPARRAMATVDELRATCAGGVEVGAHGVSHDPLTRVADLRGELREPRAALAAATGEARPRALSFPHGSYDERVLREAREAGYELMFTQDARLNPLVGGRPTSDLLHRIGIAAEDVQAPDGSLAPDRLARGLWRARVAA